MPATFTTKRLIVRDAQGLTGKKVELYSLVLIDLHVVLGDRGEGVYASPMTTAAQLRKGALDLPEVEQIDVDGMPAFAVGGVTFAWLSTDKKAAELRMAPDAVDRVLAEHPTAEALTRGREVIGVRIPLTDVNGMALNDLVAQAWRRGAPPRLRASFDAAMSGEDAGDLPAIGRPATRALAAAGITSLEQVATRTEAELGALHGVGPRAVRLLRTALDERGLTYASDE